MQCQIEIKSNLEDTGMKKLCILIVLFGITFNAIQAQLILKPAEPNEVCMEAWQNYHKADVIWKTGWGLFGAGAGMTLAGCISWTTTKYSSGFSTWQHPGFSIMCVGLASFVSSIPCLAVGQVRRKAAMTTYFDNNCSPETCADIKINYKKANTLWKTGWGLFGAGLGLSVGGSVLWLTNANFGGALPPSEYKGTKRAAACDTGFAIMIIGCGMEIASIPCLAVGQVRRKAAAKLYNEKCGSDQPVLSFSLQTSSNGLGIAMQF